MKTAYMHNNPPMPFRFSVTVILWTLITGFYLPAFSFLMFFRCKYSINHLYLRMQVFPKPQNTGIPKNGKNGRGI